MALSEVTPRWPVVDPHHQIAFPIAGSTAVRTQSPRRSEDSTCCPVEQEHPPAATATSSAAGYASPGAAYSSSVYTPTSVYSTGYTSTSVYESGTSILSPDSGGEETQGEEGYDDSSR